MIFIGFNPTTTWFIYKPNFDFVVNDTTQAAAIDVTKLWGRNKQYAPTIGKADNGKSLLPWLGIFESGGTKAAVVPRLRQPKWRDCTVGAGNCQF